MKTQTSAGRNGSGRHSARSKWLRRGLQAGILAITSACGRAPSPDPAYEGPPQDSLAAVIRNIRAGEEAAAMGGAVAAAARVPAEHLSEELQDAMTHALALSIEAEDSVLRALGTMLEDALAAGWSQDQLAATVREIPSHVGPPTARQTVSARLVARLEAGKAGHDLLAALAEALVWIADDHYPMHAIRNEVAAAWAKHHSAEQLTRLVRSIATGSETPEQAAAVLVLGRGRYWEDPPDGVDSTGVTHQGLRAAVVEALAYTNEIENGRAREGNRLEAIGGRARLDSMGVEAVGRSWARRSLHRQLAQVAWDMRDPATLEPLAGARAVGPSLEPFGAEAVSPILAALADSSADRDQLAGLLADLSEIAARGDLPAGSTAVAAQTVGGFLSGETLRAMQITDPRGDVFSAAIELAVALEDSTLLRMVGSLATDPAEMVRAGVAARRATDLAWDARRKIGWTPRARSHAEIAAELRTVPRSERETLAQMEAAVLASRIDPELRSDTLRTAMIEAWDHARSAVDPNDWYRVESTLEDGLRAGLTSAAAVNAIRAISAARYGPEQALAVEFAFRLGGAGDEELRLAMIAALEHLNEVAVDEQSRLGSPAIPLQRRLVYAIGGLGDARAIPALARSGWGFNCNTRMPEGLSGAIAREILAVIGDASAPPRRVRAGLGDLAVLLVGNNRTGRMPEELVEEIVGVARGYLNGTYLRRFGTLDRRLHVGIAMNAIFLAAAHDEPELVALAEGLAANPEAVSALGFTDVDDIERIRTYARDRLAQRPILALGDC